MVHMKRRRMEHHHTDNDVVPGLMWWWQREGQPVPVATALLRGSWYTGPIYKDLVLLRNHSRNSLTESSLTFAYWLLVSKDEYQHSIITAVIVCDHDAETHCPEAFDPWPVQRANEQSQCTRANNNASLLTYVREIQCQHWAIKLIITVRVIANRLRPRHAMRFKAT